MRPGPWTIAGTLGSGARLRSRWATRKSPGSSRRAATGSIRASTSISSSCRPAAAAAARLHLWRRLLTVGPKEFGETYYLGTLPLIDHDGLFDVLVGTHNVVEAQFAFDPQIRPTGGARDVSRKRTPTPVRSISATTARGRSSAATPHDRAVWR